MAKRIRREDSNLMLRWGDKEICVPFKVLCSLILLIVIVLMAVIIAYSDWQIGKIKHSADDVPKPKIKVTTPR